jgi:beta-lactamase regulating signal transducer with metallopeptidase domain
MNPSLLTTSPVWIAAGWTMLHMIWLGASIGVTAALGRRLMTSSGPEARYGVALALLLVLAVSPVVIFMRVLETEWPPAMEMVGPVKSIEQTGSTSTEDRDLLVIKRTKPLDAEVRSALGHAQRSSLSFLVPHLPWFWLFGSFSTSIAIVTGLIGVEQFRRQSRLVLSGDLPQRCRALADSLGIARRVSVGICDRVAMPVLIGIIRPLILLPSIALSGWSVEQLEMVLLHELAHLRRWDNLVNLLQRFVESLLFFHPVVWWLSGWVRLERELCCDRVVVSRLGEPVAYAEMLAALSQTGRRHHNAVVAVADRQVIIRIRRLFNLEESSMKLTMPEGLGMLGAVIVGVSLMLSSQGAQSKPANELKRATASASGTEVEDLEAIPDIEALTPLEWLSFRNASLGAQFPTHPRATSLYALDTRRVAITQYPTTPDGVATYRCRGGIEIISESTKFGTVCLRADEALIKRVVRSSDKEQIAGPRDNTWFEEANVPMEVHLKGNTVVRQEVAKGPGAGDAKIVRASELDYDFVTGRLEAPPANRKPAASGFQAPADPPLSKTAREPALLGLDERSICLSARDAQPIEIKELPREIDGRIKYVCKGGITVVAKFEGSGSVSISADEVMIVRKCRFGTGEAIKGTNGGTWVEDEDVPTEIHATGNVTLNTDWENAAGKVAHWTLRADQLDYDIVTGRLLAKNVKMEGPDLHVSAPGIETFVRPAVRSLISSEPVDTPASDKPRPTPRRMSIGSFRITGAKDGPQQTVQP